MLDELNFPHQNLTTHLHIFIPECSRLSISLNQSGKCHRYRENCLQSGHACVFGCVSEDAE